MWNSANHNGNSSCAPRGLSEHIIGLLEQFEVFHHEGLEEEVLFGYVDEGRARLEIDAQQVAELVEQLQADSARHEHEELLLPVTQEFVSAGSGYQMAIDELYYYLGSNDEESAANVRAYVEEADRALERADSLAGELAQALS